MGADPPYRTRLFFCAAFRDAFNDVTYRGVSINYLRIIDPRCDKRYVRIRIKNIFSLLRQGGRSIDRFARRVYPRRFLSAAARKTDLVSRISRFLSTLFSTTPR